MKPLFLQLSSTNPHFQGMIDDHKSRHLAYCKKWDYEYMEAPAPEKITPWTNMELIRDLMAQERWSRIFWIDADTFVSDFDSDMRNTLPPWAILAMTIHATPWLDQPVHHANAGIMYWRCCEPALELLDELIRRKHEFNDNQHGINTLMFGDEGYRWQKHFRILHNKWNCNMHNQENPIPIVAAFHGCLDPEPRRTLMQNVASLYPVPNV